MARQRKGGWLCCFRPKVAEASNGESALKEASSAVTVVKEDSANEKSFARASAASSRAPSDDLESFGSPASSYVTCFSEQDPHDILDTHRCAPYVASLPQHELAICSLYALEVRMTPEGHLYVVSQR